MTGIIGWTAGTGMADKFLPWLGQNLRVPDNISRRHLYLHK